MITKRKQECSRRAIVLAAALMCVGSGLNAADSTAPEVAAAPKKWDTSAAAALTLTHGNSDTLLVTLSLHSKRKMENDEIDLGVSGGYGESTVNSVNTKNTEFLQGYGQYNRSFSERFYGGLRLDGQYDGIAGIDYRFKISPIAGYYLIKNTNMLLALEGGPSLIMEHLKSQPSDAYWAARLAQRFEYKLTATTRIWESFEYLPKVDQWVQNYLANFEAGIETAINKHWSLRVVFQDQYASEPAPDRKKND